MAGMTRKRCGSVVVLMAAFFLLTGAFAQPLSLSKNKTDALSACVKGKGFLISKTDVEAHKLRFADFKAGKKTWAQVEPEAFRSCRVSLGIPAPPQPKL
jgi:hypothetical protein